MRAFAKHNRFRLPNPIRQDGGILIEVVFSTLILATVTGAILTGVSGGVKTGVLNRERSVLAQLAEQDQERMRSYKATSLDGYSQTRTVTVRKLDYTVQSSTQWIFDSSGTKSCTSDTSQASFLRLVSTVTPAGGRPGAPVTATSLLTPPNGTFSNTKGSLAVMVVDRNGAPRPNLTVNITGASASKSDVTNSLGCANFFYVPVGNYTVTFAASGLVDRAGSASPSLVTGVVGGQSTLVTEELDVPVNVDVKFDTKVGPAAAVAAPAQHVRLASSGFLAPGYLTGSLGTFPATNNTFTFNSLFPFTTGFAGYGGNCDKNNPTQWVASYSANTINVTPGQTPNPTITARLPAIWIRVRRNNANLANARVKVTPTDTGCTSGQQAIQLTDSGGNLPKPGYPWGNYTVCADDTPANPMPNPRKVTLAVANTSAVGTGTPLAAPTAALDIVIPLTGGTTGQC